MTKLTATTFITTTDGKQFTDRKEAVAHQLVLDRTSRIAAVLEDDESALADISGANDTNTIARVLASLGEELLVALNVPSGRKPRTPKAVPAAA